MRIESTSVNDYFSKVPEERQSAMNKLREIVKYNLPKGFEEQLSYGMPGYVVPHSIYPGGYHCDPKLPLPFVSIASQKNFIAVYHLGIYASPELMEWFVSEYPKHCSRKLDMGKLRWRQNQKESCPLALTVRRN